MSSSSVVSALYVYPVKSLRGCALQRSMVDGRGLRGDRQWMIVDEEGRFRTQRQLPQMTGISTALTDEALILSSSEMGSIEVPFQLEGPRMEATVWKWQGWVDRVDEKVDSWLSEALKMDCRLVTMPADAERIGAGDSPIAFQDAAATLVAGEASLRRLNESLEDPVPMDRFRANVILAGSEPYAEDEWTGFRIGDVPFRFAKRCGRCLVTTTDQRTGERHPREEPLRTLVKERLFGKSACFGSYYVPEKTGIIAVGDPLILS